jgi:hypothetical protein
MKGSEAAKQLRGLAVLVGARAEIEPEELASLVLVGLGVAPAPSLSEKRAAAGRKGGQRSVEARRERGEGVQPKQRSKQAEATPEAGVEAGVEPIPKQTRSNGRSKPEATVEANPKQNPLPASPPTPSPPILPPVFPTNTAAAKDLTRSAPESVATNSEQAAAAAASERGPTSLGEALELAIGPRAVWARDHEHEADWLRPEQWPEVQAVAEAFWGELGAAGLRLGPYARDKGVQAIVALYAAGYFERDLVRAARAVAVDAKAGRFQQRPGLSLLTFQVVERALGANVAPEVDQELVRRAIAAADGERAPARARPRLGKLAGAGGKSE